MLGLARCQLFFRPLTGPRQGKYHDDYAEEQCAADGCRNDARMDRRTATRNVVINVIVVFVAGHCRIRAGGEDKDPRPRVFEEAARCK